MLERRTALAIIPLAVLALAARVTGSRGSETLLALDRGARPARWRRHRMRR